MDITVKNVPEAIHRVLKREAKKQGRTLNAEIIQVLATAAVKRSGGGN
jgi:predicted HicB family RNase H-like nuclease